MCVFIHICNRYTAKERKKISNLTPDSDDGLRRWYVLESQRKSNGRSQMNVRNIKYFLNVFEIGIKFILLLLSEHSHLYKQQK